MKILGCDLHAKQQTIAMVDMETGEFTEKTLARSWRAETVEYCQLAVIQVWQPKHSAMIVWFCFAFAHANGLPRRRNGTTAGRPLMQA
jgi:hypothetical protein